MFSICNTPFQYSFTTLYMYHPRAEIFSLFLQMSAVTLITCTPVPRLLARCIRWGAPSMRAKVCVWAVLLQVHICW